MNYKHIHAIIFIAVAAVLITGCKEEDPFNGIDNYVSSFQLNLNGTILTGVISENNLSVVAPENLSLNGAIATAVISENSTIIPNPSVITDWDNSQTFTVTSHNGTSKVYNYSVTRSDLIKNGNVTLLTQADVEAFSALEISEINGSLTIGATSGTDSVKSLASLSKLETITNDLIINPTYCGNNLSGLENLKKTGSIQIGQLTQLKQAVFPTLTSVMTDIIVSKTQITSLEFPELVNVDNKITITSVDSMVKLSFPKLKSVVAGITIQGTSYNQLDTLLFSSLEEIGGNLAISTFNYLTCFDMPKLKTVTTLTVSGFSKLTTLLFPELVNADGNVTISDNPLLTSLNFSSLTSVFGYFYLQSLPLVTSLNGFASLKTVGGDMKLYKLNLVKNMDGFASLTSVGGTLTLNNLPLATDLSGLGSLTTVGDLGIYLVPFKTLSDLSSLKNLQTLIISNSEILTIEEIDINEFEGLESVEIKNVYNSFVLKGPAIFNGTLSFSYSNFELEGFEQVTGLTVSSFKESSNVVDKEIGIKTVTGNLNLYLYNISGTLSMPYIQQVGGTFTSSGTGKASVASLKTAGNINITASFNDTLSLPALETVSGNFYITTANYQGAATDIQIPLLSSVGGVLNISGYSSYYSNKSLKNLNGFSSLKSVGSVSINFNTVLSDYSGLKNAFSSFTSSNWTTSGNSFNPTYQDLVDGKWVSE